MNSLKAMLSAQAKEGASNAAHTAELQEKQDEISKLEHRVAELEVKLAEEKIIIEKLEKDLENQKEQAAKDLASVGHHRKQRSAGQFSPNAAGTPVSVDPSAVSSLQMPNMPSNYVSPDVVAKHKKHLSKLEQQLRVEKKARRNADGEVIKLRAAINGVQLTDSEVKDLLLQKQNESSAKRYVVVKIATNIFPSAVLGLASKRLCIFMGFAIARCRLVVIVFVIFGVNLMIVLFSIQRRSSFEMLRHLVNKLESELQNELLLNRLAFV